MHLSKFGAIVIVVLLIGLLTLNGILVGKSIVAATDDQSWRQ